MLIEPIIVPDRTTPATSVVSQVDRLGVEVLLLGASGWHLPVALEILERLTRRRGVPTPRVVLTVDSGRLDGIHVAMSLGVSGLLDRECPPAQLRSAVLAVANGQDWVAASLVPLLAAAPAPAGLLTSRETQVLQALAAGRDNQQVAAALGISAHTVANHVRAILRKLGAANRLEAVSLALRRGLLDGTATGP